MITLKQAALAAEAFARDLYPTDELQHLRLEEAEMSGDGRWWQITLGWAESAVGTMGSALFPAALREVKLPRVYKTFFVDAESGVVASMKIRQVA